MSKVDLVESIFSYIDDKISRESFDSFSDAYFHIFRTSQLENDYLGLDYMIVEVANCDFVEDDSVINQMKGIEFDKRVLVLECFLNVFYYNDDFKKIGETIWKTLSRNGFIITESSGYISIRITDVEVDYKEGTYCKVIFIDDDFVIKQLKEEYWDDLDIVSRFKNEFKIMNRLSRDDRFLKVFDFDGNSNLFFMQRAGCNLFEFLEENRLTYELRVDFAMQLLSIVCYAFEDGTTHRDLHIGNVLVEGKKIFITDFGLGKNKYHPRSKMTKSNTTLNYNEFIAPEVKISLSNSSDKSEVYSVGKVIDYIMTNAYSVNEHFLLNITEKAYSADPNRRHSNVIELSKDINDLLLYNDKKVSIEDIEEKISEGIYSQIVEEYLLDLVNSQSLASKIVTNNWKKLYKIIDLLGGTKQERIVGHIEDKFIGATRYGKWSDYDTFGILSYNILIKCKNVTFKTKVFAIKVFSYCADTRYSLSSYDDDIKEMKDYSILVESSKQ